MTIPYTPQNVTAEQSDGNILISWDASLGAASYLVFKSTNPLNFYANVTTTNTSYIDYSPGYGNLLYYQIVAVSSTNEWSGVSSVVSMVAAPPSEMSLGELRLRCQQTADRVNSQFVTTSEWNSFIRLAMYELYDLLITVYEDYYVAPYAYITTNATTALYPLPDGSNYFGGIYNSNDGTPIPSYYKLLGVDLGVNTSNNAWVTINKYNYIDRNQYVYPNSTSTIYGVYNMRYRVMGSNISFIPTPAGNQQVRLTYIPRLKGLLSDTDVTTLGISGWLRYVIARSAKYALDKEEGSDTSKLDQEIAFLKQRIQETAVNRDAGQPDKISETRKDTSYGGVSWGSGGGQGGW